MPSNRDGTTKQGDIHTFQRPCSGLKNWQRRGKKWFAISSVADWKLLTWLWWFSSAPTWLPYWQLTWLLWPVWPKRFRVRRGSSTTVSSARLGQSTQCYLRPSWAHCLAGSNVWPSHAALSCRVGQNHRKCKRFTWGWGEMFLPIIQQVRTCLHIL